MPAAGADLHQRVDRLVQSKYSPDAVVIDADLQIIQFRGHTSAYLDPTPGDASLHLLRMARESLVMPLRRVLQMAMEVHRSVMERGVPLERAGRHEEINLEVTPLHGEGPEERYWMVVFATQEATLARGASEAGRRRVRRGSGKQCGGRRRKTV